MNDIELEPCPFCGRTIEHYTIEYRGAVAMTLEAECDYCSAVFLIEPPVLTYGGGLTLSDGDAIATRNRRENQ